MANNTSNSSLALTPLGAGDLIDRAFRFYRQNFWTFIWIAAPPILFGTLVSIVWTILGRELFNIGANTKDQDPALNIFFAGLGGIFIFFVQLISMLTVMGGASRNFVRHILFGEAITFRETYTNVRSRFFGLFTASFIIIFILSIVGVIVFYIGIIVAFLAIAIVAAIFNAIPPLMVIISSILGVIVLYGTGWLFFLVASRFAYVPQIMLVEGQSVGSAIGRSTSLASGNVKRIYALFIFTLIATYSAILLLYVPLGWYAYVAGIEVFRADPNSIPAWYVIASQIVTQVSLILLSPILMIGLCLLYVDERVRSEGYDIELMAARNLGEIPAVPIQYANPLQPALANQPLMNQPNLPTPRRSSPSTLGLN